VKILGLITITLRELSAKATLIVLAGISTLIILGIFLSLSSSQVEGGINLLFFGSSVGSPIGQESLNEIVHGIQATLTRGLFLGIVLFGVIATAGIIPSALEKGIVDLYLSKPIARWELLLGKYLGAIVVILVNIVYFVSALSLVFGIKVGVWNSQFFLSSITLTFAFACLFSVVAFLGVLSRGPVIPIIGAFLYLFVIGGLLEQREQTLYVVSENPIYRGIVDGLYYLLPQVSAMESSIANQITQHTMDWRPFAQSILSAGILFGGSVAVFNKRDF
jgi:ABC-type transport system involved in multi-copper enzyme maturation permease subunit